jgi:hypothetical protein
MSLNYLPRTLEFQQAFRIEVLWNCQLAHFADFAVRNVLHLGNERLLSSYVR